MRNKRYSVLGTFYRTSIVAEFMVLPEVLPNETIQILFLSKIPLQMLRIPLSSATPSEKLN